MKSNKFLSLLLLLFLLLACRKTDNPPEITGEVSSSAVRLGITTDGIYHVTLSALQDAGMIVDTLDAANLRLTQGDTAVPILIQDNQLIFYGQAPSNRYTATRPYILTTGEAGEMMTETAVSTETAAPLDEIPQTLHLEENNEYLAQARQDDDSDLWFWQEIGLQQKADLTLNLPSVGSGPATMRLRLWGISQDYQVDPDHDFDLILNDQKLETVTWDGETYYTAEVAVPAGLLKTGNNHLTLDNTPAGAVVVDIASLNWVELDYMAPATAVNDRLTFTGAAGSITLDGFSGTPTLFDVTNPTTPVQLTGADCGSKQACLTATPDRHIAAIGPSGFRQPQEIRPLRTSDWHNTANQADLLIITTDALAPGLDDLIAAREAQGLTVALLPVAEIYDEFGAGDATPDSILAFVQYAATNWQDPKPRYLLLVGDATTDYRNYGGTAPTNIIPPFIVPVAFSGETVSDTRLVDVDGDMQPDLAVGRWPVDTLDDVRSLAARTIAQEQEQPAAQALFAADGTEAQFADMASRLANGSGITDMTLLNGATADEVVARWNEGAWLTTYVGHGSVRRWGKEDVLNEEAVDDLQLNTPSIVIQLTCLSGLFAHPTELSLTEQMMRQPEGPVLLIAATSLTLSSQQEVFANTLLQDLQDPAYTRIGDAVLDAHRSLNVDNEGLREISDTFTLFGDPSALIMRPAAN
ncbi:MAG: hypothetical protein H6662_08865 [Ardenticatenaceae bacterium]|nr:hypothetical protein [Ardenticatenaceae bacterium]MCB9003288.1 hypothetical protein [Ardenticatenaceae bacterium]